MNILPSPDALPDDSEVAAVASTVFQPLPDLSCLRDRMAVAASMLRRLPKMPSEPVLVFATEEPPQTYAVPVQEEVTVGRSEDCQIAIMSGSSLSRKHFRIAKAGLEFELSDLGSTNGTQINEDAVLVKCHRLRDGDLIHAGDITFLFVKGDE